MTPLVLLSSVVFSFVLGTFLGQRSPAVCIVGTCCARATRCEGHARRCQCGGEL